MALPVWWLGQRLGLLMVLLAAFITVVGLRDDLARSDVALVLGSRVNPDGEPSKGLRARLDRAAVVFQEGLVSRIIVSGGMGREGFDEAKVMKRYLIEKGVPEPLILEDSEGVNTAASARNTVRLMEQEHLRSVLVVSQYYHIARARLALEQEGVREIHSAHGRLFSLRDLYSIPREVAGYVCYSARRPGV